jgi:CDP-ribitol ribitolphosphotransferase
VKILKSICKFFFSFRIIGGHRIYKILGIKFKAELKESVHLDKRVLFLETPAIQDIRNHFHDYLQKLDHSIKNTGPNHLKIKDFGRYRIICTESSAQKKYKNQIIVNVWHSSGFIKKAAKLLSGGSKSTISDYALCPSENMRELYSKAFGVPKENILVYGSLKTDYLFNDKIVNERREKFFRSHPKLDGKKLYVWCPTFRGGPKEKLVCNTSLDLDVINDHLDDDEMLLIKLHPNFKYFENTVRENTSLMPSDKHNRILNVSDLDLRDLTIICKCFISDYSASILDAITADKPVLFFAEDLDEYIKSRGLTFDYRNDVPNLLEKSTEREFLVAIRTASIDTPKYKDFKENWVGACKGDAGEKLFNFLKEKLDEK